MHNLIHKTLIVFLISTLLSLTFTVTVFLMVGTKVSAVTSGGLGVYWDQQLTNPCTSIDWGSVAGDVSKTLWLKMPIDGTGQAYVITFTDSWNLDFLQQYIMVCTDLEGRQLTYGETAQLTVYLVLTSDAYSYAGTTFSFNLNLCLLNIATVSRVKWENPLYWNLNNMYAYQHKPCITSLTSTSTQAKIQTMTLTDYSATATVDAPSGAVSTITFYTAGRGKPTQVTASTTLQNWDYNPLTDTVTVTVTHSSVSQIILYWETAPPVTPPPYGAKITSLITLTNAPLYVKPSSTVTVEGILHDPNGNPIANQPIQITWHASNLLQIILETLLQKNQTITIYTDSQGKFTFQFKAPDTAGKETITITYQGSATYTQTEYTYTFTVEGIPPPDLTLLALVIVAFIAIVYFARKRRQP